MLNAVGDVYRQDGAGNRPVRCLDGELGAGSQRVIVVAPAGKRSRRRQTERPFTHADPPLDEIGLGLAKEILNVVDRDELEVSAIRTRSAISPTARA